MTRFYWTLATGLLAAGCFEPIDHSTGDGGVANVEDYLEEYERLLCEIYAECGLYSNASVCLDAYSSVFDPSEYASRVSAGTVLFDPEQGRLCLEDRRKAQCPGLFSTSPASCAGVFKGTLPSGAACRDLVDCASSSCTPKADCDREKSCCLGSCSRLVSAGGDCSVAGTVCDKGTGCWNGRCVDVLPEGSSCSTGGVPCEPSTVCVALVSGESPTCVRPPRFGDPCLSYGACDTFLKCNATTLKCESATWRALGEACTYSIECTFDAYCFEGKCAMRLQNGAACSDDIECIHDCIDGKCARKPSCH